MADHTHATSPVETQRRYLEGVAKKVADELWGPNGPAWGTTLTELEDVALAVRAIVAQKLLQLGVERQAAAAAPRPATATACPSCQRAFDASTEPVPRTLDTRGGQVAWDEPREYCPHCRRSFFPAEPQSGDRPHAL